MPIEHVVGDFESLTERAPLQSKASFAGSGRLSSTDRLRDREEIKKIRGIELKVVAIL